MQIQDSKILITGGGGLIGSTIADQLIERGAGKVVLLDNFLRGSHDNVAPALESGKAELVVGDIKDRELVRRLVKDVDSVVHMAALRINHCIEEPRLAFEVMFEGTFNVFQESVDAGIERIVAASSSSIFGQADTFPTDEMHHPYNDTTLYGAGKIASEGMLRSFNEMYGLTYAAMRFFNVYGPRMDIYGAYTEVMVRWMERIEAGEPPLIFGDGDQSMDFTYIDDVARACVLAMEKDFEAEAFNIGTGISTSLNDLCHLLCEVMESNVKPEFQAPRPGGPVNYRLCSTEKSEQILDFKAEVDLRDGLQRLVNWWRDTRTAST